MKLNKNLITNIIFTILCTLPTPALSAEKITFFKNVFSRSVSVKELEDFSKTGKAKGLLQKLLKNQNKQLIRNHLTKEYKAPIILTSRLMYSQIGEVILTRVSKIIYPYKIRDESIGVLAIKAATIKAIRESDESINLINFLKSYPSEVIAIDVTELAKVLNKVESMSELVKFFTSSPLENLKSQQG